MPLTGAYADSLIKYPEIIQDFDNIQYRLRPIDFDQQCYEGRKRIYLPQYYRDNIALVELAQEVLDIQVAQQYMREERVAMRKRFMASKQRTKSILRRMKKDRIASISHCENLAKELGTRPEKLAGKAPSGPVCFKTYWC